MKALIFLTQFYQLGGAERLAIELAEDLNKRGIHADILSQYSEDLSGVAEAKARLLASGIPAVHFLDMEVHPSLASTVSAVSRLRRLIRDNDYDIIETSMVMPTAMAAWATRGTDARQVAGLHQVFRRDRENTTKHKLWRLSVRMNPRVAYYAISDYVAEAWKAYVGVDPASVSTVYNGIPEATFDVAPDRAGVRRELGIPNDARIALYVGRLAAYKGIDTALEALGPVLERENLHLLYVGRPDLAVPGTEQMIRRMKEDIERSGWGERVAFLEFRPDVPRLMASSDVLVHPARMEGFGLVLVEALATGLPVVASDVEGIPEVLSGTRAQMASPDDPNALRAAVLDELHRAPEEAAAARVLGRERAEAFRASTRVDALIDLFEKVAVGRPQAADLTPYASGAPA